MVCKIKQSEVTYVEDFEELILDIIISIRVVVWKDKRQHNIGVIFLGIKSLYLSKNNGNG